MNKVIAVIGPPMSGKTRFINRMGATRCHLDGTFWDIDPSSSAHCLEEVNTRTVQLLNALRKHKGYRLERRYQKPLVITEEQTFYVEAYTVPVGLICDEINQFVLDGEG